MAQRIKGQEVELLIAIKGQPQITITDVKDAEFTIKHEILTEEYVGESTPRKDEIYKGYSGRFKLHIENDDIFNLILQITNRSRRRDLTMRVNIKATLNFPNGDRPRMIFNDAYFGEVPINIPGRSEYLDVTLNFEGSDYNILN